MAHITDAYTRNHVALNYQWPLLLTWFNFNPSMDKLSHNQWTVVWNYLSIPKLQRLHRWSFGNWLVIPSHILQRKLLLIHAGIKVNPY